MVQSIKKVQESFKEKGEEDKSNGLQNPETKEELQEQEIEEINQEMIGNKQPTETRQKEKKAEESGKLTEPLNDLS